MSDIIKKVEDLLNEEKWTRAALTSYSLTNFQTLDEIVDSIMEEGVLDEVVELCNAHLDHSKNSIIALYLSGIVSLAQHTVDDSGMMILINIFSGNHKWNIVEFLCNKILSFGENKHALRTLADCYENENDPEKKIEVWERLIKIDYEEAKIVKNLAEIKEDENDAEQALFYYKKAIHRFINKKLYSSVKEIWHKLIELCPDDLDFFYLIEKKVSQHMDEEKSAMLLEDLYPYYFENELWGSAIGILKKILDYDQKNTWARKEIVKCYKSFHEGHSHLDEYIKLSNLNTTWRNVQEAISDFEKHISFDKGNFVFHRTWGVGFIKELKDDMITIHFVKKPNHSMSLKMAVNALQSLPKNHIWVLKSAMKPDVLKNKIETDVLWTLKTIIKSYGTTDLKTVKSELVPSLMTPGKWTSWSTNARELLKNDPIFGNSPDKPDQFMVRDKPISQEEKFFNQFKATDNFFEKIEIIMEFLNHSDPETDYFGEMFSLFTGFLKNPNVNEFVVSSYLLVTKLVAKYPFLNPGSIYSFKELYDDIDNVIDIFNGINHIETKRAFLVQIRKNCEDWSQIYITLFPFYLKKDLLDDLVKAGEKDKVKSLFNTIQDHYRESREAYIWLIRNITGEKWYEEMGVSNEKTMINLIHLLNLTYRDISNKREVSDNRRLSRQIETYLFRESNLERFVETESQDTILRVFTLLEDLKDLDPKKRIDIQQKIVDRFPDFKFYQASGSIKVEEKPAGLLVLEKSFKAKQKELKHILDVEVPENSKEIGIAMDKGDLKENAEYISAKEKQEQLGAQVARYKEDLEKAKIVDLSNIEGSRISFGVKVGLVNLDTNQPEEFTILGPWESDPVNKVISYLSPFGNELLGHKEGETLNIDINDRQFNYRVDKITTLAD